MDPNNLFDDLNPLDSGAGVGHIPLDPSPIRILPDFTLNPEFMSDDAQRNLTSSQEYQSLLSRMNEIAGDVIAKSIQVEYHEPFPEADNAVTARALGDLPSPGRRRAHRVGDSVPNSKKRPLEILPPSSSSTPFRDDSLFQQRHLALATELREEISLRPALKSFSDDDIHFAAYLLVRAGLGSISEIKLSLPLNRKYLLQDLRGEDLNHRDLLFLLKIFEVFPPTLKNRNIKHPEFEEVCIPLKLGRSVIPLAKLSGLLVPDQRMVNEISEMLARGQACSPSYVPYVFAPLNKEPWIPTLFEHSKANEAWTSRMKSLTSDQSLSFQAWTLYRLRFIFSAEVCAAWTLYGGIIAQINNVGITLNLAIAENVGIALKYYEFLQTQLESYARSRATDIDFFRLLSEEQPEIRRRFSKPTYGSEGSSGSYNQGKKSARYGDYS